MLVKMSIRDRLDCFVDFVAMTLFCLLLFFQSLLSHTLCSRLKRFSTADNFFNLWCSKLQYVSTYAFCRWDDIFTQKWNCSSPNNLFKSPKSPSSLSSNGYSMEFLLVLKQPSCSTVCVRNECWTPF